MTTPLKSPAGEAPAQMDDTPAPSTARPHTATGSAPAGEPPAGGEDPRPEAPPLAASQEPARAELPRSTAASAGSVTNTALLVGIVAAFLSVLGTAVGIPLYLMDGNIRDLGGGIEALEDDLKELGDETDARFAEFDIKLAALEDRMDARFAEFDIKLAALEDRMDARFAEQDARLVALENGQAEIDRKLTALIAHLHKTEAVETALEGRLE